ncbi:hypothetical protein RchiOBHm_Chr4g0421261 [Rosa chinensis]|uniref:Uncharacterized protein n=1 Tax=Rosa chinensis TaxID=74649 RepID=A0A2P6QY23_ROSCH|nr:hypothetical protein RchiOBHm_Chr4g0421261 [Rosa chinensis]
MHTNLLSQGNWQSHNKGKAWGLKDQSVNENLFCTYAKGVKLFVCFGLYIYICYPPPSY